MAGLLGWEEARRLGHHWVGEEHVLLALSRLDGATGEALRAAGARPERIEELIVHGLACADQPVERRETDSPAPNPAHYAALGRAEGLAVVRGASRPTTEDVLVALVWHARLASWLLHRLGVDRSGLLSNVAASGAVVPPGEPEPLDLRPRKQIDVPYDRLGELIAALPAQLPADSRFGFNFDPSTQRAWIVVEEDADAEALVGQVLGRSD